MTTLDGGKQNVVVRVVMTQFLLTHYEFLLSFLITTDMCGKWQAVCKKHFSLYGGL